LRQQKRGVRLVGVEFVGAEFVGAEFVGEGLEAAKARR
jgi:endonuclease YncB( thermonuclease family)